MDMHEIEITGTFLGHVVLGVFLAAWALVWIVGEVVGDRRVADTPLERHSIVSLLKIGLPLTVAFFEVPNAGWEPAHFLQGWQHITMYAAFALTGVVDLLARRGVLSPRAGYIALVGALLNAGFLFVGHGGHGGVPGIAHLLLALLFFVAAGFAVGEAIRPAVGLEWFRLGSVLAIGGWLLAISWVLYRSEWVMTDPVREGWTYLLFSLNGIAVAVLVTTARILAERITPRSPS